MLHSASAVPAGLICVSFSSHIENDKIAQQRMKVASMKHHHERYHLSWQPEYREPTRLWGNRAVIFVIVVLLHVGFGYALHRGLATPLMQVVILPIIVQQIDKPLVREKLTIAAPKIDRVEPYVPVPEYVAVNAPVETDAITAQSVSAAPPGPAMVPTATLRSGARVDPRHPLRIGEEYYPDASKRIGEEGACRVQLHVKTDGFIADPVIVESSGFARLDGACLAGVIGQRMLPATEDGKPIEALTVIRIRWALRKRR